MEKRPSVRFGMFSESSLTASDPEVVAPAERAAETGCSEASSASLVSSIEVGPGIEFSAGDAAHGVLPLVAERTPSLELPVWACGVSRWTPSLGGRTIPFIISLFHIPNIQTVPLFTVQYCYLNTRLLQSGKPPVFPRVAQGFVCWVFMQPRRLELPVLVPLCS